jgi:two-component system response regulator FixJ
MLDLSTPSPAVDRSPTVFLVDPDPHAQADVRAVLASVGLTLEAYCSAPEFLATYDVARPACLIAELRLPGLGGLELHQRLVRCSPALPVIILTAHGDVATAVQAMRNGVLDFLEKPCHPQRLLDRVAEALECDAANRRAHALRDVLWARAAGLRPQEREIMDQVVAGKTNASIAVALGVSRRAVEGHRARLMRTMQARSLAELVRMSIVLVHGVDALTAAPRLTDPAPRRADLFKSDDLLHHPGRSARPTRAATEHVQLPLGVAAE